jgi:hypothetical protein
MWLYMKPKETWPFCDRQACSCVPDSAAPRSKCFVQYFVGVILMLLFCTHAFQLTTHYPQENLQFTVAMYHRNHMLLLLRVAGVVLQGVLCFLMLPEAASSWSILIAVSTRSDTSSILHYRRGVSNTASKQAERNRRSKRAATHQQVAANAVLPSKLSAEGGAGYPNLITLE